MERFEKSKASFKNAMEVAENEEQNQNIATCAISMADVSLPLEEYADALALYQRAIRISYDIGSVPITLNALVGFSRLIFLTNQKDIPLAYQLLHLAEKHPQTDSENIDKVNAFREEYSEQLKALADTELITLEEALHQTLTYQLPTRAI